MASAKHYRKKLIAPGRYQSAQGEVAVDASRIDHWEKSFNELRKEGFNFPAPWGHKLNAVPKNDEDPFAVEEAYARWNSGNIDRLEKEQDGSLWMVAEVPPGYEVEGDGGRLVNKTTSTVVTDVSPGIGNWIDGQGREHKDIILHAALVTHPVQHNQTGFAPVAESTLPAGAKLLSAVGKIHFTHLLQTKGPPMADEPEDKKKKPEAKEKPEGDKPEMNDGDMDDDMPPAPGDEPEMPKMPDGTDAPNPGDEIPKEESPTTPTAKTDEYVMQLKEEMAKLGQPLMEDTDRNNIVERMVMALKHAGNAGCSLVAPKGVDNEGGDSLGLAVPGVADQNGAGGLTGIGGYSFMSTGTGKVLSLDPATAKFAAQAGDVEKAAIAAEWDRIAAIGPASMQAYAHKAKTELNNQYLSINPETSEVMLKAGRRKLADGKEILKASGYQEVWTHLLGSKPILNPVNGDKVEKEAQQEADQEMVQRAFGPKATLKS